MSGWWWTRGAWRARSSAPRCATRARSPLHLPYISLHLPCISPTSPLHLRSEVTHLRTWIVHNPEERSLLGFFAGWFMLLCSTFGILDMLVTIRPLQLILNLYIALLAGWPNPSPSPGPSPNPNPSPSPNPKPNLLNLYIALLAGWR